MDDVTITPTDNGPSIVRGTFRLGDVDGNDIPFKGPTAALCRCGASENKPFCDGTHVKIGFLSSVRGSKQPAAQRIVNG